MGILNCCSCSNRPLGTSVFLPEIYINPKVTQDDKKENNNDDNNSDDSSKEKYSYPTQEDIQIINEKIKRKKNVIKEKEQINNKRSNLIYEEGIIDSQIRLP